MTINLSENQKQEFERDGVILLRGLLDPEWQKACFEAWQWSVTHPGPLASGLLPGSSTAFQDLCNPHALPVYDRIVHASPLADVAARLWASSDVWYMYEQVFHKHGMAGRTPWHQDTSYLAVDGAHLIAFWISFESIPARCGLEFVRGSHRGPLYNTSRFDPEDPTLPIFPSDSVPTLPDVERQREQFDIISFATEPGDVVAFHTSVLHGGGAVDDRVTERRTLTLRFFGHDSRSARRPGAAGPFYDDIKVLRTGDPFRHPRFAHVLGAHMNTSGVTG